MPSCTDAAEDQKQFALLSLFLHVSFLEVLFTICFLCALVSVSYTLKNLLHSLGKKTTVLFNIKAKMYPEIHIDKFKKA